MNDPKSISDIPIAILSGLVILGFTGLINSPYLNFFSWVLFFSMFNFLVLGNVLTGGYKNDWHRNEAAGDRWREGAIAVVLLFGLFGVFITKFVWEKTGSSDIRLLLGTILISILLGYLNVKFRYKIFKEFTPEEKENPIRLIDLAKYIRWYHWLIFLLILLVAVSNFMQAR